MWVVFWQRGAEFQGRKLIKVVLTSIFWTLPFCQPGAAVSSSVKPDGFCSGAAGPVFCSLSPAFLECSAVGRRWKSGLRESRLQPDESSGPGFCFSSPMVRRWKAGRAPPAVTPVRSAGGDEAFYSARTILSTA